MGLCGPVYGSPGAQKSWKRPAAAITSSAAATATPADTVPSNGHRGRARALTGLASQLGDVGVLHAD